MMPMSPSVPAEPEPRPGGPVLPAMLNKLPEATANFWLVKIWLIKSMSTIVGETAADTLNVNVGIGLLATTEIAAALVLAALAVQLRLRRHVPASYWAVVVLVGVVGTLVTDALVDVMGVSLVTTTIGFGLALAAAFAVWWAVERTLSIRTIVTTRRELFYWAAILLTFALGTAAGHLMVESLGLGPATSAAILGGVIGLVFAAHVGGMNAVLSFWLACGLTWPFGASIGDLLSQPPAHGGLGLGTTDTSALFLGAIAGLVGAMTMARRWGAAPGHAA